MWTFPRFVDSFCNCGHFVDMSKEMFLHPFSHMHENGCRPGGETAVCEWGIDETTQGGWVSMGGMEVTQLQAPQVRDGEAYNSKGSGIRPIF